MTPKEILHKIIEDECSVELEFPRSNSGSQLLAFLGTKLAARLDPETLLDFCILSTLSVQGLPAARFEDRQQVLESVSRLLDHMAEATKPDVVLADFERDIRGYVRNEVEKYRNLSKPPPDMSAFVERTELLLDKPKWTDAEIFRNMDRQKEASPQPKDAPTHARLVIGYLVMALRKKAPRDLLLRQGGQMLLQSCYLTGLPQEELVAACRALLDAEIKGAAPGAPAT